MLMLMLNMCSMNGISFLIGELQLSHVAAIPSLPITCGLLTYLKLNLIHSTS